MGSAKLVGKEQALRSAMASIARAKQNFAKNLTVIIAVADHEIKALTPVNTGQAVRNMIWTAGHPNSVVFSAIDNGPTGPTNTMSLGSEPRRNPNEQAAEASLLSLNLSNPFQAFYLTNLSPDIGGLELGVYPGPPLKSRSPNGMFGLVHAQIAATVAAKGMLK
jgi:hypothetical protein